MIDEWVKIHVFIILLLIFGVVLPKVTAVIIMAAFCWFLPEITACVFEDTSRKKPWLYHNNLKRSKKTPKN